MQKLIIKLKFTHTFSHVFFYKFYSFMLYISSLLHFDYLNFFFLRWRFVSRFIFLFTWASKSPSTSWGKDIPSHLNAFALLSNIILLNWHGYISGFPFLFNVYVYFFTSITPSWLCGCSFASVVSDLFRPPWTIAHQALLSVGFPRQEYCSGLPFSFPQDLPDVGVEPASPALADGYFFFFKPLSHLGSPSQFS